MLNLREDQKAQVLEDKKVNEPHLSLNISETKNGLKKFKSSESQPIGLNRSNCDHYVLDSHAILSKKMIHENVSKILEKHLFKVSRIKKTHSDYIRLSISFDAGVETRNKVLKSLKYLNSLKIKKLKMRPNNSLKNKDKEHTEELSILTLNINNLKNKVEELDWHLQREKPAIVCLQETGRQNTDRKIFFSGYSVDEVPVGDTGLGLLIGVRKNIDLVPKVILKTENVMAFSIKTIKSKMIVINLYRPPRGPERKQALIAVSDIFRKYEEKDYKIVAVGDWNSTPQEVSRQLEKALVNCFTEQVPTKGTRIRKSRRRTSRVIDFGISNQTSLIKSQTRRRKWNMSDHVPILVRVEESQKTSLPQRKTIFDRDLLTNRRVIKEIIKSDHVISENSTADSAVTDFNVFWKEKLQNLNIIRETLVNKKSIKLPNRVKRLIKDKRKKDKLVRKGELPLEEFTLAKKAVKTAIKKLRRKRYLNFIKQGIEFLKNNDSRNSWRWVKKHCKIGRSSAANSMVIDPITKDLVDDPKKKLGIWANHFYSLCKKDPNEKIFEGNNSPNPRYEEITDSPIRWDEIVYEYTCTRNHKASGIDNIPSEFYKIILTDLEGRSHFSRNMLLIFNKILNEGICPRDWEECVIVPVFKKGDPHDPSNYRGIALINTFQKLFSKILARRLQVLNQEFNILKREQAGFIKSEECVSQAACLLESLQRRKIRQKDTFVCFLDLKKAYDMVPHNRLIAKLKAKELGPKFIKVIESMYSNTRMSVRIGQEVSETFRYERGVRQGCPTSPLLFNIYIDDLLDEVQPVEVEGLNNGLRGLLFADDTVILAESKDDLEQKLKSISKWMDMNSMEINPSKCGIMIISDQESLCDIKYKGEQIPRVDKYTYLGIEFNRQLDLQEMSSYRVNKGVSKVMALSSTLRNNCIPLEYKKMLIGSIVAPTVLFGAEIFGMSERRCSSLRKVVDTGLSMILKSRTFSRNRAYEEFDLKPVQIKAAVSRARGFSKWSQSNGFIKDLINSSDQFKSRKHTWSKTTKMWLKRFRINLAESTSSGRNEVLNEYIPRVRQRDHTQASRQATQLSLGSGKQIRRLQLNNLCPSSGLYHLTRLRTGTFQLTNKLVFNGTISPSYINKCAFCGRHTPENNEHLMTQCSAWREERRTFLGISGVNSNNPQITDNLSVLLKSVLGGNSPASGRKPADWIVASGNFLSAISRKRAAIVAALKQERM